MTDNKAGATHHASQGKYRTLWGLFLFSIGLILLLSIAVLLQFSRATDYLYHATVKDPARVSPNGPVIVSPADGTVLYVRRVLKGTIPQVIKQGVPVPIADHLKMEPLSPFEDGYLIGIYMNTQGVHVNRVPDHGILKKQFIFNGPHMNMTKAETEIILSQLLPGMVSLKKLLGIAPFDLEGKTDYILNSARETLVLEDSRKKSVYIVRIADYWVGRILTWVPVGTPVTRGEKLGMITWGSQTDIFFENSPGMEIQVGVGDYVYGGESILATY
ncbi:MAG: phosphatidylserine decarboxylase [Halieaceae bacterium]|jgi:phosphatidylserine decarboxylase|nr:phosphatidylserine decarboxylase [Halieaceae bacterium]